MTVAWLNGEFLPLERARVSVLDRGFLFADAVYEVIPVYAGRPFRLAQHLLRLDNSLRGVKIPNPRSAAEWTALLRELVARNGGGDQSLYLQVTRGAQPKRDHAIPEEAQPTTVAFSQAMPAMSDALRTQGAAAITAPDSRWRDCHIKSTALLPNVLARHEAAVAGAAETLLIRDGEVLEGSSSNIFAVMDNVLITPPKSRHILLGITRDLILELAREHRISHAEQNLSAEALPEAAELWLTSSTKEVVPVTRLDGRPVGDGKPGPLWRRIDKLLQTHKESLPDECNGQ